MEVLVMAMTIAVEVEVPETTCSSSWIEASHLFLHTPKVRYHFLYMYFEMSGSVPSVISVEWSPTDCSTFTYSRRICYINSTSGKTQTDRQTDRDRHTDRGRHTHTHTQTQRQSHTGTYRYIHRHRQTHKHVCICTHAHTYTHAHIYKHTYNHMWTHTIHTHIYTCTHTIITCISGPAVATSLMIDV